MPFPPRSAGYSAGNSSGRSMTSEWSSGGGRSTPSYFGGGRSGRSITPNNPSGGRSIVTSAGVGGGGRSIMTAGGVSRAAVLPSATSNGSRIRPMTGLARIDSERLNRGTASTPTRIVESAGYYQSMLQTKIEEILEELDRLRSETEMADGESDARRALDKKLSDQTTVVQDLEGQLADFQLAHEQRRSGAALDDVRRSTAAIVRVNNKMEEEIDAVFFSRKDVEEEEKRLDGELKRLHESIESKLLDGDDGNDDDVHDYRALVKDTQAAIDETKRQEEDTVLLLHKLKTDGFPSRYAEEKKRLEDLKKQLERVEESMQLALMTEDEAREYLLVKARDIRYQTKKLEEECSIAKSELATIGEMGRGLRSELRARASGGHERFARKEERMKHYLDTLPETKAKLEEERAQLSLSIDTLREGIGKNEKIATSRLLPSSEELELMQEESNFTEKQLEANAQTMTMLQRQKEARAEELEQINTLDERIRGELEELAIQTDTMAREMAVFSNLDGLQDDADAKRDRLTEAKAKLTRGIELLDGMLDESNAQLTTADGLENSQEWKELQGLKPMLPGRFKLQEEAGTARTQYSNIKEDCLRLVEGINQSIIQSQ